MEDHHVQRRLAVTHRHLQLPLICGQSDVNNINERADRIVLVGSVIMDVQVGCI
jgi:hypothetical protein